MSFLNDIKETLGAADVTISDGITEGISLDAKVGEKLTGGFTYTITNSAGTYTGEEQNNQVEFSSLNLTFPKALFLNGSVVWNLGSDYQLKDGWTYQVSFKVWPDQNVYDTVAKLNAGTITEIPGQYSGILINDNGTYKIKTNVENADVTKYTWHWSETSGSNVSLQDGAQSKGYNLVDPMPLVSQTVQVQKTWQNSTGKSYTDDRIAALGINSVDITVTGDGAQFSTATLNAGNSWSASNLYIAPGLVIQRNGSYTVLDKGHSYTATETMHGGTPSEWEMASTSVRPMRLGDSTGVKNVLLVEDPQGSITIDGTTYSISNSSIASITVNNRKTTPDEATITIEKALAGEGAETDREFNFTMQLTLPEGTAWNGGDGFAKNADGTWSFNLKGGESITATLPIGAGYQISEESLTAYQTSYTIGTKTQVGNSTGNRTVSGEETITFTNTHQLVELTVTKTVDSSMNNADPTGDEVFTMVLSFTDEAGTAVDPVTVPEAAEKTKTGTYKIKLKANGSVSFKVAKGTHYSLTETDLPTYFRQESGDVDNVVLTADTTATVVNYFYIPVPTGVRRNGIPAVMMIFLAGTIGILMLGVRRRTGKDEED